MKKIFLVLGLAAVAGFAGCSKDTTTDLASSQKPMGTHTIKASVVADKTRTALGDKVDATTPVLWTKGDQIMIVDQDNISYKYILQDASDGQKSGDFTVSEGQGAIEATSILAFYPHSAITWSPNASSKLTLPAAQTYVAGRTFGTNMSPMYAKSTSPDELQFHHLAGVINLQLTSLSATDTHRKVTKIELSSTDNQLAGPFQIVNDSDIFTLAASTDAPSKTITMDCSANGGVEMTQTPACFLFVVPAQTYAASELKFTITVHDGTKEGTVTLTMPTGRAIAQGEIVNIAAKAVPNIVQVEATPDKVSEGILAALEQIAQAADDNKPTAIQVTVAAPTDQQNVTVTIPEFTEAQKEIPVMIQMPEITSQNAVTITAQATNAPAKVSIAGAVSASTTVENAPSFTINMPATTVSLAGTYKAIEATTAANTLVIERGTKIGTLTLKKGNVEIQGYAADTFTKIVKDPDWSGTITYMICDGQDIVNMAAEINRHTGKAANSVETDYMILKDMHFKLMNDIDMTGIDYIPMGSDASYSITASAPGFAGTFDGNNHTIRNINISGNDFKNNRSVGLFGTTYNATINDLNIENVTVQYASKWAGGLIGDMQSGTLKNCHVKNVTLCTKPDPTSDMTGVIEYRLAFRLGGLVGICRSTCNITDCSVDGADIKGHYSIGGLIGACNVNSCKMTITNCKVDNIIIEHMIAGAYGNYYDSSVLLGDCDPALQITMVNITLGKWEIKGMVDATEATKGWTNQTWAMFPYLGEKPSNSSIIPTLDGASLTVTPLSKAMLTSESYNAPVSTWGGEISSPLTPVGNNYAIYTAAELAWMNKAVNEGEQFKGKTFTLERDIDLNNREWVPMGSQSHSFSVSGGTAAGFYGTFDGQNHSVSNVNVNVVADAKGLFGKLQLGAVLKNLTVKKISIPKKDDDKIQGKWVGGMVGLMAGDAQVENCHAEGVTINAPKMYRLGGLIGFIQNTGTGTVASVKNCSVKGADITGGYALGGLVGTNQKKNTTIEKCSVSGIVLTHKDQYCWKTENYHSYDAAGGYVFASGVVVGDSGTITLKDISVGTWEIVDNDKIEGVNISDATWTHLPYVGEVGSVTLDDSPIKADANAKLVFGTQYTGAANRQ